MNATLEDVTKKKKAELTTEAIVTALNQEMTGHLGHEINYTNNVLGRGTS